MDADKRHELKQNELAQALARLRSFGSETQTRYWLLAAVVIVVAVAGYFAWGNMRKTRAATRWMELATASSTLGTDTDAGLEQLHGLIASTSDPVLAADARIRVAAVLRDEADADPEKYEQCHTAAIAELRPAIDDPKVPAPLVATATYALAISLESLRKFDEAAAAYQTLVNKPRFAGSPLVGLAASRLSSLAELRIPVWFEPGMPPPPPRPESRPTTAPPPPPPTSAAGAPPLAPATTKPADVPAAVPAAVRPPGSQPSGTPAP
jgi:predicted negative regulator of RcsB-dependent stress response